MSADAGAGAGREADGLRRSGTSRDPRIAAYLRRLDRELADTDPQGRAEILRAVRDHIDARLDTLGHEPTDDDVSTVLADLGSPGDVAGRDAHASPRGRRWLPALGVALVLAGFAGLAASGPLLLALTAVLALIGSVAVIGSSQLWRPVETIVATLAVLVGAIACFFLDALTTDGICAGGEVCAVGSMTIGSDLVRTALVTVDVALVVAAAGTISLLTLRGHRRSRH